MSENADPLQTEWVNLASAIQAAGRTSDRVLAQAMTDRVSPEVVLEGFARSKVALAEYNLRKGELPPFERFEAVPPGAIDPRVFDQTIWWVDFWRTPYRVDQMGSPQLVNVIEFCRRYAPYLAASYHRAIGVGRPADPEAWLEATVLMRALRRATAGI